MRIRGLTSTAALVAGAVTSAHVVRFAPREALALAPAAFGMEILFGDAPERGVDVRGDVAVVEVVGPLVHHAEPWLDSYDAIKERIAEACATNASAVLLSIDSPGGLVAGCFDAVTEIRAIVEAAGKPLHAYIDAQATSAAYALATAADKIWIPPAGIVGSIGVIEAVVDATSMDEKLGVSFTLVRSGARKADGNPHAETTPEALAALQGTVDYLAERFFEVVASRRGLEVDAVRAMEAGIVVGQQAIDLGLADELATFDQVIAALNSPREEPEAKDAAGLDVDLEAAQSARTHAIGTEDAARAEAEASTPADEDRKDTPKMSKLSDVKTGLQAAIDDEESTPEERNAARKALAALDAKAAEDDKEAERAAEDDEPAHDEPDGDEPPAAEDDEPDGDEPKDEAKDEAKGATSALALAARVQELEAREQRRAAKAERARLMAARPDFAEATVAWLNTQSIAVVRSACATPDKGGLPLGSGRGGQVAAARAAAQSTAVPTAGAGTPVTPPVADQGKASDLSGDGARMDAAMGLTPKNAPIFQHGGISGNEYAMRAVKRQDARRLTNGNGR